MYFLFTSRFSIPDARQPIIHQYEPEQKRRPGRPRGSKNRRRDSQQPPSKPVSYQSSAAPPTVDPQNQQYYEFQWRVLNLCAEFYSAAEELVVSINAIRFVMLSPNMTLQKGANPLVIAQCYAAPESKVDPLVMLTEAKRVCDTLVSVLHMSRKLQTRLLFRSQILHA